MYYKLEDNFEKLGFQQYFVNVNVNLCLFGCKTIKNLLIQVNNKSREHPKSRSLEAN